MLLVDLSVMICWSEEFLHDTDSLGTYAVTNTMAFQSIIVNQSKSVSQSARQSLNHVTLLIKKNFRFIQSSIGDVIYRR